MLHQIYIKDTKSRKLPTNLSIMAVTLSARQSRPDFELSRKVPSSEEISDELSLKNADSNHVCNVITHRTSDRPCVVNIRRELVPLHYTLMALVPCTSISIYDITLSSARNRFF